MGSVRDVSRVTVDLHDEIERILETGPLGPTDLVDQVIARLAAGTARPDDREIADAYWDLIDRDLIRIDGGGRLMWVGPGEETEGRHIDLETDS